MKVMEKEAGGGRVESPYRNCRKVNDDDDDDDDTHFGRNNNNGNRTLRVLQEQQDPCMEIEISTGFIRNVNRLN